MSSTLFNIPANTLRPGPTLTIVRQPDGKTTASMDFTCRKFDVQKGIIKSLLRKGVLLTTLYPQAGTEYNYLILDGWTARDEPGGITTVTCDFIGVDITSESDSTFESASIVYTRNNTLSDKPIWQHPDFLELATGVREALKDIHDGKAKLAGNDYVLEASNDRFMIELEEGDLEWYDLIIVQGHLTYQVPASEWTKSATGRVPLTTQLNDLGKIVVPPGNPKAPDGQKWLMTGATESISAVGDGVNSYSLTYTSGVYNSKIYETA